MYYFMLSLQRQIAISPLRIALSEALLCHAQAILARPGNDLTALIAAIAALPGTAGLYPGKLMDDLAYTACLSFTLVHELFHATQMILCQLSFYADTSAVSFRIK